MRFSEKLAVKPNSTVHLSQHDPRFTDGFKSKTHAQADLEKNVARLRELQYLLYAEGKRSLLIILQGMDASGKDGTVSHVMGALNPQSCRVTSFKEPSAEELKHDYLWRIHKATPERGEIMIFNRSHYEDVLVVRVGNLVPKPVWKERYEQINDFEKMLAANDVMILKFFLHISKEEQKGRLEERLKDPMRQWKASPADLKVRERWDDYVDASEDALTKCSTEHAPWYIVPADHKWFRNLVISQIIVDRLDSAGMAFPEPKFDISKLKVR